MLICVVDDDAMPRDAAWRGAGHAGAVRGGRARRGGSSGRLAHFLNHAPVLDVDATIRKPFKPGALFEAIETVSRVARIGGPGHSNEEHDDGR